MEILQLKHFSHAAKTENFSHTAQHFMVPASNISASIKKLEKEIGIKLFDRTSNSLKLNEYGKILFQAINKSEEIFKKAKADIFDLSQSPFGKLNLLIMTNRQKVTDFISNFKDKYPKITFNIKHQVQINQLDINNYDIIIADQNIPADCFSQKFWLREELFLAVPANNKLSNKNSVSSDELVTEKFICMPKGSSLRYHADKFFQQKNLDPDIIIECDDPQYIRNYLKMGLGVTFFPSVSWKNHISNDIVLLRIDGGLYRNSYIYTNKSSSNIAHLFSDMLEMS